MKQPTKKLVIKRLLKADRTRVFSALTDPAKMAIVIHHYFDLTPKGRDEAELKVKFKSPQSWVRYHDRCELTALK